MMKATLVISQDDANTYFLGIDLETGALIFEDEKWTYADDFNEDKYIEDLSRWHNATFVNIIHW